MAKSDKIKAGKLARELSAWINDALDNGACPQDLTYILAGVSVDMGLKLAGDPNLVLRIVLGSVSDQLALRTKAANDNGAPDLERCPIDTSKMH